MGPHVGEQGRIARCQLGEPARPHSTLWGTMKNLFYFKGVGERDEKRGQDRGTARGQQQTPGPGGSVEGPDGRQKVIWAVHTL